MSNIIFLLFVLLFSPAQAQESAPNVSFAKIVKPISLGLPIECELGTNCHVLNYVDMKPDDGQKSDPYCGARTYDAHKGTDFALIDKVTLNKGVNVLAAMDGTINRVRDGEEEGQWSKAQLQDIRKKRKECGNAVLIDHENKIQTIYCHLKKGSIQVKPEQNVKKGDIIAQVGQSGFTEFPHLHFGLIKDKMTIDPFTSLVSTETCRKATNKSSLWGRDVDLQYEPLVIQSIGLSDKVPILENIDKNSSSLEKLFIKNDILALWVTLLGARKGDQIDLKIIDSKGKVFSESQIIQDKTRTRQFYFTGQKNASQKLRVGSYKGLVKIERKQGASKPLIFEKSVEIKIEK